MSGYQGFKPPNQNQAPPNTFAPPTQGPPVGNTSPYQAQGNGGFQPNYNAPPMSAPNTQPNTMMYNNIPSGNNVRRPGGLPPPPTNSQLYGQNNAQHTMQPPMTSAPSGSGPPLSQGGTRAPPSVTFYNMGGGGGPTASHSSGGPPPTNLRNANPAQTGIGPPPKSIGNSVMMGDNIPPNGSGMPVNGNGPPSMNPSTGANTGYTYGPGQNGPPMGTLSDGSILPGVQDVDMNVKIDPAYMRATVNILPDSQNNAISSKLPLGIVIQPMAKDTRKDPNIEIVDFGSTNIVRCRKCRTYINPYVQWIDNGRKWRCNCCGVVNDVPSTYFHHLDANGQRRDKAERPELRSASVELIAPQEYMVRPPVPPVYVFVIDVSYYAIASGMVQTTVETIKNCLDDLPGIPRTQIGIVTFDNTVHFHNFKKTLKQPQVLVVPDVNEIFVPLPDDLLVNLNESKDVIIQLLDTLPQLFQNTKIIDNALGPALTAAYRVMGHIGGKLSVFTNQIPTIGEGRLKPREDPRILGTDREHHLFNAEDGYYRTKAIEFSRVQISVDLYVFASQYADLATLSVLPKYTSGTLYYYPNFNPAVDHVRFQSELSKTLNAPTGFEAVMRIRPTKGLKITGFYGNYYIRGNDLLSLPNCNPNSVFAVELEHSEAFLNTSFVSIQAALLHTSSAGERRIRVHTIAIPVSRIIQEVINSIDIDTMCNVIAKRCLEISIKTGPDSARTRLQQTCSDIILRSSRPNQQGSAPHGQNQQAAQIPSTLELLPLYTMALMKNAVFRGGADVRVDYRVFLMNALGEMSIATTRFFIFPRMFAIHDMDAECGRPFEGEDIEGKAVAGNDNIIMPVPVSLTADNLRSDGIYLLENGISLYLWVGRQVDAAILSPLFNITTFEGVDIHNGFSLQQSGSDLAARLDSIINALREERSRYLPLRTIVEGDPQAAHFYWNLVEDKTNFPGGAFSYAEFVTNLLRRAG